MCNKSAPGGGFGADLSSSVPISLVSALSERPAYVSAHSDCRSFFCLPALVSCKALTGMVLILLQMPEDVRPNLFLALIGKYRIRLTLN